MTISGDDLITEPGWVGYFTRAQAPGAFPNGTHVVKRNSERGDAHGDGSIGLVVGSFVGLGVLCYFVEGLPRATPRRAVGTVAVKLALYTGA